MPDDRVVAAALAAIGVHTAAIGAGDEGDPGGVGVWRLLASLHAAAVARTAGLEEAAEEARAAYDGPAAGARDSANMARIFRAMEAAGVAALVARRPPGRGWFDVAAVSRGGVWGAAGGAWRSAPVSFLPEGGGERAVGLEEAAHLFAEGHFRRAASRPACKHLRRAEALLELRSPRALARLVLAGDRAHWEGTPMAVGSRAPAPRPEPEPSRDRLLSARAREALLAAAPHASGGPQGALASMAAAVADTPEGARALYDLMSLELLAAR